MISGASIMSKLDSVVNITTTNNKNTWKTLNDRTFRLLEKENELKNRIAELNAKNLPEEKDDEERAELKTMNVALNNEREALNKEVENFVGTAKKSYEMRQKKSNETTEQSMTIRNFSDELETDKAEDEEEEDSITVGQLAGMSALMGLGQAAALGGTKVASELEAKDYVERLNKIYDKTTLRKHLQRELLQDVYEAGENVSKQNKLARNINRKRSLDRWIMNEATGKRWLNALEDAALHVKTAPKFFSNSEDLDNDLVPQEPVVEEDSMIEEEIPTEEPDKREFFTPAGVAALIAGGAVTATPLAKNIHADIIGKYKDQLAKIIKEASKENYITRQYIPFTELHHNNVIHRAAKVIA